MVFHGVYLLYSRNPRYLGRTYIGYTVDPDRRIKQHNKGKDFGGAHKTSNRGPWDMVLIVYGFPNDISALRFEWAWQHPKMSRRLQHVARKKSKETTYTYCLRLLHIMLQTAPWQRLPLTVQWLKPEYQQVLTEFPTLPKYMAMKMGPLDPKLVKPPKSHPQEPDSDDDPLCSLCHKPIEEVDKLTCPKCTMLAHMICLANYFLRGSGHYVPVDGKCVECAGYLRWGDLIEKNRERR